MSLPITNQDRKKVKTTYIVAAILFALFALLSILFGVLIPDAKEVQALGEGKEDIRGIVETKDGSDYFLNSEEALYRYDAFTNELISVFSFSEIEKTLKDKGDYDRLVKDSLNQWSARYVKGDDGDYYVVNDGNGNLFKLADDGKNLQVTDDYYLADKKTVVKGCDYVENALYCLTLGSDNFFYVQQFDVNALNGGMQKSKLLWDLSLDEPKTGYHRLVPMAANTGILSFVAAGDVLYVFKDGGGVTQISTSLIDFSENGQEGNYYALADAYYTNEYPSQYEEEYKGYFRKLILAMEQTQYTEEQINAADKKTLVAYYTELTKEKPGAALLVDNAKTAADTAAKEKAEQGFTQNNAWCGGYDKAKMSMYVAKEHIQENNYSVLYSGQNTVYGMIYSPKNKAVYYTNAADGYLYYVNQEQIDAAQIGSYLSDFSTRIEGVRWSGKKFSNFGNGLSFNRYSNTLYVKFANERTLALVDINNKEKCQILYTFEGDFDSYTLTGDADNKVLHALRQVTKVSLDGKATPKMYCTTYEPAQFQQKTAIKTLFIICLAFAAATLLLTVWMSVAAKSDRAMNKLKVIQRDFKQNKYVYLTLTVFVGLLFLFCYYEAIGALSMSFFDYTREKPSWIWNNFANYIRIFNQPDFWLSIGNMLFFLVFDLVLTIAPPLLFAFLLVLIRNQTTSGWIRSLMFIPGIIPSMASMLIWREGIYGYPDGLFNQILVAFGGDPVQFLDNVNFSRWALIFMGFPFVGGYLIFYGGMMNIPKEYHEAGRLEGLGIMKRLISIDSPLIMPQIKYIFIMTFISSVQNYARTYILASSGTVTPVENMYRIMTGAQADYGMASAYATIIFVFLFFAVATNFKMQKKETMGDDL